jgi:ADP-dependent phosphofructokinase/glucokinase
VETPSDINAVLKHLLRNEDADASAPSRLAAEDEAYLTRLVAAIRSGKSAVLIVEDSDEKLKYMFSNATRAEAVSMLGKIIEATGRRIANGDD